MALKDLLNERKISVYQCSKQSGIPYSTLNELILNKKNINECNVKTIYALANFFNCSMEKIIGLCNEKNNFEIANDWEEMKNKQFIFPKIIKNSSYPVERIHPLAQKNVDKIVKYLSSEKLVKKVYLFGSSTTIRCNRDSDLDFAVELSDYNKQIENKVSEKIGKICNYNCDILWMNKVNDNERLINNIKKGVIIYEQTA